MGDIAMLKASLRLTCFRDPAQEGLLSIFLNCQLVPGPGAVTGLLPLSCMWAGLVFPNPMLTSRNAPSPKSTPWKSALQDKTSLPCSAPSEPTNTGAFFANNNLIYSATGKNCVETLHYG